MSNNAALVWFSRDLRLADNPALARAVGRNLTVIPVFVWAPEEESPWAPGAASRWWLRQSLIRFRASLEDRGSKLIVRRAPTAATLIKLAEETDASVVFWNRSYEPAFAVRDREIEIKLRARAIGVEVCPGNVLFEPGTILNGTGKPFQVFTAFWNACRAARAPAEPVGAPRQIDAPKRWPTSLEIGDLGLQPENDWAAGIRESWRPGERGAWEQAGRFLKDGVEGYAVERDRPDRCGTSGVSAHLHFGEVSARTLWHDSRRSKGEAAEPYLRQLAWREFSYHLMHHFPHTMNEPLRPEFARFPWRFDGREFKAWTKGATGYPMVDAGMRELWRTGWMHNRVRMLAASFLVKHLLIPWQEGARWFWDTLVDADLANNTMGWQWSAGCGADAAPYFRIFNPVLQGEKFDPEGAYVRRWVPELSRVPSAWIHRPWEAPPLVLAEAGVELGKTYPWPIVDHETARKRALAALATLRAQSPRRGS